jgi:hypothetical protein
MLHTSCPQITVLLFVSVMATYGYYIGDTQLIAPLAAILITGATCGACFVVDKCCCKKRKEILPVTHIPTRI